MEQTRKSFIQACLTTAACCCPALRGLMAAPAGGKDYYRAEMPRYLAEFQRVNEGARQYLTATGGQSLAAWVTERAAAEFRALIPTLPYIGGAANENTPFLVKAAWYAAYYPPMRSRGKTAEDVGAMIYRLNEGSMADLTRGLGKTDLFSPAYIAGQRAWAERTRRREYTGDWAATIVAVDEKNNQWGCDYHECGIVKYLRSLNMGDLAPFICVNDFLTSRALGTGLRRTGTLAEGADRCDFRYKKGRTVTQDWSTEIGGIRKAIQSGKVRIS